MRKIVCTLIGLILCINNVVALATEQDAYDTYENFIIEETEDTVLIKGCVDTTITEIYVPGEINGKKVKLKESAFYKYLEYENLESIVFGEGIKVIPKELCYSADNLKNVEFSSTVKKIGESAFFCCKSLKYVDLKNVEEVGADAFSGCEALVKVDSNGKIRNIMDWAFAGTTALKKFDFEGVEYLGNRAFIDTGLENIYLTTLKQWDGIATNEVDAETNTHEYTTAGFNGNPAQTRLLEEIGTPFIACTELNTVRVIYPENGGESYKSLFIKCEKLKNVIFENFPAEPSKWEFYNTTVVKDDLYIKPPTGSHRTIMYTSQTAYLKFVKPEFNFTIYGRGEDVKAYAESIGVPFKELIDVYLNSERIWMDDCLPYIKNDRTLVPMRAIFEALGAEVSWEDATKTAIGVKDGVEIKITIGENVLYKNGEATLLDCAAEITNDRTMVPVRAISEAFGCTVTWNDETKTVEITN